MKQAVELIRRTGNVVQNLWSPQEKATSGQVRMYGVAAWSAGLLLALAGAAALLFLSRFETLPRAVMLVGIFPLAGFGLMTIGGYRAFTGRNEEVSSDLAEISPLRVVNGLFCLLASFVIAGGVATAFLYYLQSWGVDPRTLFKP